jgi:hypothetical protein
VALRGTLKDFALPDIFQLIGMQRKTGLLTLKSERETVTVFFEGGMVVLADSSVRRLDDLLGNVLVRQGKLRKSDLDEALAKQKVSMQRLGYILTSQGYIDADALKEALSEQVQQIVFRVFRWKDGQYDFDPTSKVDYDQRHVTPVSTDHILMEGIRRVDEWPIIEKRIPSLRMVFRTLVPKSQIQVTPEGAGDSGGLEAALDDLDSELSTGEKPPSDAVVLSEAEASVYRILDGKRSISTLVDMTGLSDFDVSRTIFDLIERNLVEPVGHQRDEVVEEVARPTPAASPMMGIVLLLVVVAVAAVGIAFTSSTPFRIPGRTGLFPIAIEDAKRTTTLARMERVDSAIRTYFLSFGDYPNSLEDLLNANPALVSTSDLLDANDTPFLYDRTPDRVALAAMNEAGEPYLVFVHEVIPGTGSNFEGVAPERP